LPFGAANGQAAALESRDRAQELGEQQRDHHRRIARAQSARTCVNVLASASW
jgi:hypothetical protein